MTMASGKQLRDDRPPSWMAEWEPPLDRDPLGVLERAAEGRDKGLVKKRNKEMTKDDPEFFRGAAGVMAADLAASRSQVSGVWVDICGDAHIGNFGTYGSPERQMLFDINDFDEARYAPWEWDLCRLAASAVVVARAREMDTQQQDGAARAVCTAYAETVAKLGRGPLVDRWYRMTRWESLETADLALGRSDDDDLLSRAAELIKDDRVRKQRATVEELTNSSGGFNKDKRKDGTPRQTPIDDLRADEVRQSLAAYRDTLPAGLRRVLGGYQPTAVAIRPVGAGSLGLRSYIVLMRGRNRSDALILQVKEATPSQLEFGLDPTPSRHEGERVVRLQQMLQGASDPLLGWTSIGKQQYYVRQFRDMKGAPELDDLEALDLVALGRLCGTTLARAHARSASSAEGQLRRMSAYIGDSVELCDAVVKFAHTYAGVTTRDRDLLDSNK
jgi:uncharacterized protein (DUF2252 family)